MDNDEIINRAILELKENEKPYMMFNEFSFMKDLEQNNNQYNKIRYLLIKSIPFEKHTDHAIKFSSEGFKISNDYKNWFDYKKTLKQKIDYAKWGLVLIASLSLAWNIYQGIKNNSLKDNNRILHDEIEALEKEKAGLQQQLDNLVEREN